MANSGKYLATCFKLAEICEFYKFKSFQYFPLRKTFTPSYITIDTMVLNNQNLEDSKRSKLDKSSTVMALFKGIRFKGEFPESHYCIWKKAVNLSNKAIKDQGPNKTITFRGTIMKDGVGASIVKQSFEASKGSTSGPKSNVVKENFQYHINVRRILL
ncbi:hypothetical protein INT48_009731 [Thamnidium elegans]|uniref:Uncharacterized protein n=1 Tax=Thamnidium elegans TaxID=101142 RepID=A0A8H7T0U0_9FUNG|nr:hypothetical protein INT48_009731 [Thamnidium elegans]